MKKLTPHVGVEISGLDLHQPINAATADALREAFRDNFLLLVRQPGVSAEEQARFAQVFGEIVIRGKYQTKPEDELTQYVSNNRADGILGNGEIEFHQDHVFYETPLSAIILYGVEIPPSGSATKFRNTNALLQILPGELRRRAEGVKCLHLYDYQGDYTKWQDPTKASPDSPRAWHPMIWTNPETGKEALWAMRASLVGFEGIGYDEGWKLVEDIWAFAAATDEFTYVHTTSGSATMPATTCPSSRIPRAVRS
jgi:taurine dioxygenase